ncbi:MAG: WD40 repeat domain-containing protein [Helicobacteraceae bacterium]|nr:WD40 repeat domain-containing protein [Candidatus Sulfurimonas ponti]MBL6972926.1 WD40 repeat domain-containing protein [Sulfurimonas sp.]
MLETSHCLRTRSFIQELKKLDNNLIAIATVQHGVRLFSCQDCENKASISHEHLNSNTTAVSFSPNAEFMAFAKDSFIFILHMPSKIVLKTIKADTEIIQKLKFDLESKYIIAATQSGRVLQYRYDGSSLLGRLYSFEQVHSKRKTKASAVSSFAFYKNIMACGGNNGAIFMINLHSRANKMIIKNNGASRITSLCFLDDARLLSTDSLGKIYLNSTKNAALIKQADTGFIKITQALLMPNPKYLMIIGGTKNIAVYDTVSLKLLHNKYVEFEDIVTSLEIVDENTLIATLKHSSVEKIELPTTEKLKSFIISNQLSKAYDLVKKDPLLLSTKEFKVLEIAYKKVYSQALDALIKGNKDVALKITRSFKYVDAKKDDIDLLYKAFDNYPRFKSLYIEKKYALAYAMAAKLPPLKRTFQYAKMQELWRDTCDNAQRQIAHGHHENALTLLSSFASILEKRPYIKLILKHNDELIQFNQALQSKDYKTIHNLADANPIFTLITEYRTVEEDMNKELMQVQKYIDKCDVNTAVTKLSKLQNIHSIQERVNQQKEECRAVKKLQDMYELNDFIKCYEIIDNNPFLNTAQLGELLQKHWLKIIHACEGFALKGNVKNIKETLGELIHLETRRDKIGDLFRLAFHTKIKAYIAKKSYKKAELILYSYIDIFGLDNEIKSIMKIYENKSKVKLALTHNLSSREERDKWIDSQEIMGK